jgi:hypothetical protein
MNGQRMNDEGVWLAMQPKERMSDHTRTIPVWDRVGEVLSAGKRLRRSRRRRGASDDDRREEGFPRYPPMGLAEGMGWSKATPKGGEGHRGETEDNFSTILFMRILPDTIHLHVQLCIFP